MLRARLDNLEISTARGSLVFGAVVLTLLALGCLGIQLRPARVLDFEKCLSLSQVMRRAWHRAHGGRFRPRSLLDAFAVASRQAVRLAGLRQIPDDTNAHASG